MVHSLKSWTLELWALAGTLATAAVLVALLAVFDGRAIFDWKSITLNTIISLLSVVIKALLLFAVAECIGQWKWILLHRQKRSLLDFERIDLASRGPLGCLDMAWRRTTPWLLRLGLVVTILTMAVDPFSQQLVQIDQGTVSLDSVDGTRARTPRSVHYSLGRYTTVNVSTSVEDPRFKVYETDAQPDLGMEAVILQGLAQSPDAVRQGLGIVCPSSANCTFDQFETLGVCHRCADLTDRLERVDGFGMFFNYVESMWDDDYVGEIPGPWHPDNATAFALPNGLFLSNTNRCRITEANRSELCRWESPWLGSMDTYKYVMTAYGTGHPQKTNTFQDVDTLLWSTSIIHLDERARKRRDDGAHGGEEEDSPTGRPWNYWPTSPLRATECALYYCVKEVEDAFTGNLVREVVREADGFRRTLEPFRNGTHGGVSPTHVAPENVPDDPDSLVFDRFKSYLKLNDLTLRRTRDGVAASYVVADVAFKCISSFFQDKFRYIADDAQGMAKQARKKIPAVDEIWNGVATNGIIEPDSLRRVWNDSDSDVEARFETLAMSMTNDMRRNSGLYIIHDPVTGTWDRTPPDAPVMGRIHLATIQYRASWYWITLHTLLLLGSFVFCVATMMHSRDLPVWKSHSLATMSQGPAIVDFTFPAGHVRELETMAEATMVSLAGDEELRPLRRKGPPTPDPGHGEN